MHVLIDREGFRVSYRDKYDGSHAEICVSLDGETQKSTVQYDIMERVLRHREQVVFENLCHDIAENMGIYADSNWKRHVGEDAVLLWLPDEVLRAYECLYHTKPTYDLLEHLTESEVVCKGFDHMLDVIADRERTYCPEAEWTLNPKQVEAMREVGMSTKDFV